MEPKPDHLGREYAGQFADDSVVAAYRRRPPYPPQTFDVLRDLPRDPSLPVLDVGCGRGNLTWGLARFAPRVDAVEPSAGMLAAARREETHEGAPIRWIHAGIEDAPLAGPYGLATAGQSLHWTEWKVSLPRLASLLAPGAVLALVDMTFSSSPWEEDLARIIPRFSTNQRYQPYDLVDELEKRGLFRLEEQVRIPQIPFEQTVDDYVESFHSANGFSRDRMPPDRARAFDAQVRAAIRAHGVEGTVAGAVGARIRVGRPMEGA